MIESTSIEHWPAHLEAAIAERCTRWRRVMVLRETDSTQDAARRLNVSAGDVVVAGRQTAGRGRFGRMWADTAEEGVAITAVIERASSEWLAVAAAVGVARASEKLSNQPVGIKWPNDILVNGRKLAGILIEQTDAIALIGVGLNVHQTAWPEDLAHRAVSLKQLGVQSDRLEVMTELLIALDEALRLSHDRLIEEYRAHEGGNDSATNLRYVGFFHST